MKKSENNKKKFVVAGIAIIVLVAAGIAYKVTGRKERGVVYRASKVTKGDVKVTILSTGTVAPENRLDLKPPVTGRIEKILVQEGQKVKKGQVLAWMSSTERATLIDTAVAKGPDELQYWEDSYKMTPILAPGKGLIILKSADTGQTVMQTDIILSMSDRLIVKANVDETDLALIKLNQPATIILDAFPGNPLDSKVVHIGYDAKTVNNVTTYEVDVVAEHTPDFMKSGMTANVTFLIDEKDDTLLVSATAIKKDHHKTIVLMPNPDKGGDPIEREVKVGISDGKRVEILSGLSEGEDVLSASLRSLAQRSEDRQNSNNSFSPLGGGPPGGGRPPR